DRAFGAQRFDRVRAEPAVNVPKARIIAEGNIISEAASFARKGKHHSRPSRQARPGGASRQRIAPHDFLLYPLSRVIIIVSGRERPFGEGSGSNNGIFCKHFYDPGVFRGWRIFSDVYFHCF
ncbi:MAG: hypothetical protein IIZ66_06590, partial [Clostridia bacterium]|nr:hypothetical protein [Clostridia bacterium]